MRSEPTSTTPEQKIIRRERCEATTQEVWYAKPHRCPFKCRLVMNGQALCLVHYKLALKRIANLRKVMA